MDEPGELTIHVYVLQRWVVRYCSSLLIPTWKYFLSIVSRRFVTNFYMDLCWVTQANDRVKLECLADLRRVLKDLGGLTYGGCDEDVSLRRDLATLYHQVESFCEENSISTEQEEKETQPEVVYCPIPPPPPLPPPPPPASLNLRKRAAAKEEQNGSTDDASADSSSAPPAKKVIIAIVMSCVEKRAVNCVFCPSCWPRLITYLCTTLDLMM